MEEARRSDIGGNGSVGAQGSGGCKKTKQFDDGLYAAAELEAMNGCDNVTGKRTWLAELCGADTEESLAVRMHSAAHLVDDIGRTIAYLWDGPATPSDVVLTLTVNGETLTATQDFPRAQFRISGTGTRQ